MNLPELDIWLNEKLMPTDLRSTGIKLAYYLPFVTSNILLQKKNSISVIIQFWRD